MQVHVVPERFARAVTLHIAKNVMATAAFRPALILGIHGTSGDGKTYQCELTLRSLGVEPVLIAGSQLESDRAGEPARLIRETYIEATRKHDETQRPVCIVINDFDTGVGNWGDRVQYTVNRQLVFGELMHLVDFPELVHGERTRRTPIIITGNDFTQLYPPLLRPGRMALFEWCPNVGEKIQIVGGIFPELSRADVATLVTSGSNEGRSVAFYSDLRAALVDELIWDSLSRVVGATVLETARRMKVGDALARLSLEQCIMTSKRIMADGSLKAHVQRS